MDKKLLTYDINTGRTNIELFFGVGTGYRSASDIMEGLDMDRVDILTIKVMEDSPLKYIMRGRDRKLYFTLPINTPAEVINSLERYFSRHNVR